MPRCTGTLFVLLLKFGAVLNIICGFLMAVSWWRPRLQCIVIVWSFLRLLKHHKLVVGKLDLLGGGVLFDVTVYIVENIVEHFAAMELMEEHRYHH